MFLDFTCIVYINMSVNINSTMMPIVYGAFKEVLYLQSNILNIKVGGER